MVSGSCAAERIGVLDVKMTETKELDMNKYGKNKLLRGD